MPIPARPNASGKLPEAESTGESPDPIPTLISIPCIESFSPEERTAAADSLGRRHAAIWEMAESGLSAEAISTSAGQPIGEIELILALRRQIQSASRTIPKDSRP